MANPFRFTTPVPHRSVTGRTAEVYSQLADEFGIERAAVFTVLSSAPEILVPTWVLMRESLLAGAGTRTDRELVAYGVSRANRCPFCVDAHTMLLHATGDHALAETLARGDTPGDEAHARLLAWGEQTRVPGGAEVDPPPFPPAYLPAYYGSALAFHFINRMVSALLTENVLPGNAQRFRAVRSVVGRSVSSTVRRALVPGTGLALLDAPVDLRTVPSWATGSPVGSAYVALRTAAFLGAGLLDEADQALVREAVAAWDGGHPPLVWDALPDRSRPGARLAVLAALAPYRITEDDVAAWRTPETPFTDHCLVHLIAYGAIVAVDRLESSVSARVRTAGEAS
ncbi:carboxymuconolactone decarboxylase family protein [Streptomyces sp. NPDC058001]|uniref:carboxymuconolactone decarboxylase family protein n=1 Tax=Streptomyces sp. NPDC058001 TaxID=3346300 RepID=UPI0036EC01CA